MRTGRASAPPSRAPPRIAGSTWPSSTSSRRCRGRRSSRRWSGRGGSSPPTIPPIGRTTPPPPPSPPLHRERAGAGDESVQQPVLLLPQNPGSRVADGHPHAKPQEGAPRPRHQPHLPPQSVAGPEGLPASLRPSGSHLSYARNPSTGGLGLNSPRGV